MLLALWKAPPLTAKKDQNFQMFRAVHTRQASAPCACHRVFFHEDEF